MECHSMASNSTYQDTKRAILPSVDNQSIHDLKSVSKLLPNKSAAEELFSIAAYFENV